MDLEEEVISQIRACLVSTKGKCDLRQIKNDYRMIMGGEIPFLKLGYQTLEEFVCNIPSLTTTRVNGQLLVDAKVLEKSSHISNFVDKQKVKKRSRIPPRYSNRNFTHTPVMAQRWRPKSVNKLKKNYQRSPRPATVIHSQFVNVNSSTSNKPVGVKQRLNVNKETPKGIIKKISRLPDKAEVIHQDTNSNSLVRSAKRRIIEKMAILDIKNECDNLNTNNAAASLLTLPVVNVEQQKKNTDTIFEEKNKPLNFLPTGDNVADLNSFATLYEMGIPDIKVISRKAKPHHKSWYNCKIKIGTYFYSSYPDEYLNEQLAKQAVAKIALDDLMTKYSKHQSLLISQDTDILERIPSIVQRHPRGLWSPQLEQIYVETFNEELPVNWLEIVDSLSYIIIVPTNDRYILHYCNSDQDINITPTTANISVASNMVKFDNNGSLVAEITCVASAREIWCRQCNTPESIEFAKMLHNLEEYYNVHGHQHKVQNLEIGAYYVAQHEHIWCRVRVFDIQERNVNCFCIVYGDEWLVTKDNLFQLHSKFAKVEAQVFVCRLVGVEELYEASEFSDYLNSLLWKTVQVQLEDTVRNDPNDPVLPVVLYDFETGIYINQELISTISKPTLHLNAPIEGYVIHALDDGNVYVQIRTKGYEQLKILLSEVETEILENKPELLEPITPQNSKDKLYFTEYNKCWYRAKILDWSPDNKYAQLFFVDFGNTAVVAMKDYALYPLDEFSSVLNQFPHQALRVKIAVDYIPTNFVEKVLNLMPSDQPVLIKKLSIDSENVPLVEFFKRSETDNILFSVNNAIKVENELRNISGDPNSNFGKKSIKLQRLISLNQFDDHTKMVPSSGSLTCPVISPIGQYFDVKIPCAVHPHNFFVQPLAYQKDLVNLMKSLQEKYNNSSHTPLQLHNILPGRIYASRHEDGIWYRTSVIKVINVDSISVFYCDFGYYANLTLHQLVALNPEFMKLPYQAIKAKLAGIKARNSNWSMDDCKLFEKLVCRKKFVAILIRIEKDVLYRSDTVLNLKLIDTSTEEDVYIDRKLINEGIAVLCED